MRYLHRLQLLQAGLLLYLVITLIGIVLKMANVCYIAHVAYLVAKMTQVTKEQIEGYGRTGMSQVWVAVYRGTANIHAHVGGVKGLEKLLLARKRIVN